MLSDFVLRDKVYRLLQYLSKFLLAGNSPTPAYVSKLQTVMVTTRKTGRLLRFIEYYSQCFQGHKDDMLRYLLCLKHLGLGTWFLLDQFVWLHAAGLHEFSRESIAKISRKANLAWFLSLVASLLANVYKYRWNRVRMETEFKFKALEANGKKKDVLSPTILKSLQAERRAILWGMTSDLLDMLIPYSALDRIPVNGQIVGLAGVITSLMGACTVAD